MDYMYILIAICLITLYFLLRELGDRLERPYRWACPEEGCFFKMSSSDPTIRDLIQKSHIKDFHSEKTVS